MEGAEALLLNCRGNTNALGRSRLADAIIFGTPTYVAGVSAAFKAFQEASSHAVMTKGFGWKDKIAAGFTNSGSRSGDKLATLIQIALFAAQHGMHWVNLGLPPANHSTTGSEADLNRLGFWLGAGAQSNTDQGPDLAPPEADLATARHLGQRVTEATLQFVRGRAANVLAPGTSLGTRPAQGFDSAISDCKPKPVSDVPPLRSSSSQFKPLEELKAKKKQFERSWVSQGHAPGRWLRESS